MQDGVGNYGTIMSFYSYKGGTGRSMAVANIGCILGGLVGKSGRVLVIDWDLESPGLHRYFEESCGGLDLSRRPGVLDYFSAARRAVEGVAGLTDSVDVAARRKLLEECCPLERHVVRDVAEGLDFMTAGRIGSPEYPRLVNEFDWEELYRKFPLVFEAFQDLLAERWKYVLIDSRTGLTDMGSVCTAILPEKLVTVFTPNRQSLEGILDVVPKVVAFRRHSNDWRPLAVFPLASRVAEGDDALRRKWREEYQGAIEGMLAMAYRVDRVDLSTYFDEVQIPQKSHYAFGEKVAVLEERRKDRISLGRAYEEFARRLVGLECVWAEGSLPRVEKGWWLSQRRRLIALSAAYLFLVLITAGVIGVRRPMGFGEDSYWTTIAYLLGMVCGAGAIGMLRVVRAYQSGRLTKSMSSRTAVLMGNAAGLGVVVVGILSLFAATFAWDVVASVALGVLCDVVWRRLVKWMPEVLALFNRRFR